MNSRLHTGSKITFRSAERYDGIRGATYTAAVIDEAAFIKDEAWGRSNQTYTNS